MKTGGSDGFAANQLATWSTPGSVRDSVPQIVWRVREEIIQHFPLASTPVIHMCTHVYCHNNFPCTILDSDFVLFSRPLIYATCN